jgi:hypothetical protein
VAGAVRAEPPLRIHVQVRNPCPGALLRISLDGREIDATRAAAPEGVSDSWPPVRTIGEYALESGARHRLLAEAPELHLRAELMWTPTRDEQWIVVRCYPGRDEPPEAPLLSFTLQDAADASR